MPKKLLRGIIERMKNTRQRTVRRAISALALVALLAGIAPMPGAQGMLCRMDRPLPATTPSCGSCAAGAETASGPSLTAGSCCRFTPPSDVSTLPAMTVSKHRVIQGPDSHPLVAAVATAVHDGGSCARSARVLSRDVNPTASSTLTTNLRL